MDNYNKLLVGTDKLVFGRKFIYDAKSNKFHFDKQINDLDENFITTFKPKFSSNEDFKSRLENEVLTLLVTPGETRFETSYYSKKSGLRYYSIGAKNNEEDPTIIEGSIFDVTNEKIMLAKMTQAEKLRSLGELASGIAHDFNNQLMVITGSCELMMLQELNDKQKKYINNIYQSARRSSELIKKLLAFGHVDDDEKVNLDLVKVVSDTIDIVMQTTKNTVKVHFSTNLLEALVLGNVSNIENVIINLIRNSIDAMGQDGNVYISLSAEYVKETPANSVFKFTSEGYYYKVEVKDEGKGIPKNIMDKIFNPFFSTKESGKGTGLGLSTVYNTMLEHEGILTVTSEVGVGSIFTLYFRAIDTPNLTDTANKILVIDDEDLVRNVICDILMDLSYQVISFSNGTDALAYYKKHHKYVDLVISDMRMPHMDGEDVYREFSKVNPKLLFILLSGYIEEIKLEENDRLLKLSKPITVKKIDESIKKLLNK